jgi:VIT1/CCC1 family predicted Fe2+/Mn2+ transporter
MSTLKREWKAFFPNVVLGVNDALIELTGALVGFSFALRDPKLIVVAGLVTGFSASMSMSASAYQQARYERGHDPMKAALFTGIPYFLIVCVLGLPFIFFGSTGVALIMMGVVAVLLIAAISFYSARILKRPYLGQFAEMCLLSLGIAFVTFLIGHALGTLIGAAQP